MKDEPVPESEKNPAEVLSSDGPSRTSGHRRPCRSATLNRLKRFVAVPWWLFSILLLPIMILASRKIVLEQPSPEGCPGPDIYGFGNSQPRFTEEELEKAQEAAEVQIQERTERGLSHSLPEMEPAVLPPEEFPSEKVYQGHRSFCRHNLHAPSRVCIGTYGNAFRYLGGSLAHKSRTLGRDVLLVWVVEASASLKEDHAEIRDQIHQMSDAFRRGSKKIHLLHAMVTFGEVPHLWLRPTADVAHVAEALENIKITGPGTPKNVFQAVQYGARTIQTRDNDNLIIAIALMCEGAPDDGHILEPTLTVLRKKCVVVFVLGPQCPFQRKYLLEDFTYTDTQGEAIQGTMLVHHGLETARQEVTPLDWGSVHHWSQGTVKSGFGVYELSRLVRETQGSYLIIGRDHGMCWDPLEPPYEHGPYEPELVSRREYGDWMASDPFVKAMVVVRNRWTSTPSPGFHAKGEELDYNLKLAEGKLKLAGELISYLEKATVVPSDELWKLAHRRWPANAELLLCSLHLAKYRLRQYALSLRRFMEEKPNIPVEHRVRAFDHRAPVISQEEADDRAACITAFLSLANRHPNTPWGRLGSLFSPQTTEDLYGFEFEHGLFMEPYRARIEFQNGNSIQEVWVTDEGEASVSFRTDLGSRTVPSKGIRRITRLPQKPLCILY